MVIFTITGYFIIRTIVINFHISFIISIRRNSAAAGVNGSTAIGLSRQVDRRCGDVRDRILGINSSHGYALRLSVTQEISRTRLILLYTIIVIMPIP